MALSTIGEASAQAMPNGPWERALLAAQTAAENRGRDIVILDLRDQTSEFDYFVLATGASRRQLHAISDEIERALRVKFVERHRGHEGYNESRWILLDYGDIVVHLFDAEARQFYALDQLWAGAKRTVYEPSAEPRVVNPPPSDGPATNDSAEEGRPQTGS